MMEIRAGDRRAAFEAGLNVNCGMAAFAPPLWSDFDRMLDPARNPLATKGFGRFETFTALRDGRPIGRIVACMYDASNARHKTQDGQFGFFDCIDDETVARALLERAEAWTKERGAQRMTGNFNLTAMQQIGVVTEGFEHAPYTDMVWNGPHIPRLLAACGYQPVFPMRSFTFDLTTSSFDNLIGDKQRAVLADSDFSFAPITRSTLKARLEDARVLLNDGFADNPMFVPPTAEEYMFQAGDMMWIIDKRISIVAFWRSAPAGAIIAIPDVNPLLRKTGGEVGLMTPFYFLAHKLTNRRAVIIYQSVSRAMHNRGLNGVMLHKVATAMRAAGYTSIGGTWIADINGPSLRQVEKAGASPLHRLHLYTKRL